jgi:hypothetical protein
MTNGLRSKTLIFYPEYNGMSGSITIISIFMLIGVSMILSPEFLSIPNNKFPFGEMTLYVGGGICFLLSMVVFFNMKITTGNTKYFLTETKLVVESGFVTKTISALDLKNVIDLELKQTAIQNFFSNCTVIIYSNDITDPIMKIKGLDLIHGRSVFKLLVYFVGLQNPDITEKIGDDTMDKPDA